MWGSRPRGGVRAEHGERGVLQETAEDFPVSPADHRGVRDDLRGHDVLRDAQAAQKNRGDGAQVPTTPGVALGAAAR